MANLLLVTTAFAVLLGSSCSEARPSYQPYRSSRRGAGGNPDGRQLSELTDMVSMLKGDVQELKDMNTMLKEDVQDLQEATDGPPATFIAFFGPDTAVVSANETIVFPRAPGGQTVYDPTTGIFTAAVDGIYSINLSIRPFDIDPMSPFAAVRIVIRMSDRSVFTLGRLTSSNNELNFDISSFTTIPSLVAGDEVFVINEVDASFGTGSVFSAVQNR